MQASLASAERIKESDRAVIDPTLNVLRSKLAALTKVLATGPEASAQLGEHLGTCAGSPPIERYMNLRTIDALKALSSKFANCTSLQEVKSVQKELQHPKEAITDLLRQCKGAVADIKRAATGLMRLGKLDVQMSEKVGEPAPKRARRGGTIWESFLEFAPEIPSFSDPPSQHDMAVNMDLSKPLVITLVQYFQSATNSRHALAIQGLAFRVKWMKYKEKSSETRAGKQCKDEAASVAAIKSIHSIFPAQSLIVPDAEMMAIPDIAANVRLSHFAMRQGETFAQYETDGMATVRISSEGTRSVACAPFADIAAMVRKLDGLSEHAIVHPDRAAQALKTMTPEQLRSYIEGGGVIFQSTVGPHDLLYFPAGWLCFEIVLNRFDVVGFKASVIADRECTLDQLGTMEAMGAKPALITHLKRVVKPRADPQEGIAPKLQDDVDAPASAQLPKEGADADDCPALEGEGKRSEEGDNADEAAGDDGEEENAGGNGMG